MIGKSSNTVISLRWLASLLMLMIVYTGKSYGQSDSCLAEKKDSISIELTSGLTYHADMNIRVCYTTQKIIRVFIRSDFTRNGKALSERNLSRRSHRLFLNHIQYNLHDLFSINGALLDSTDFIPQEINGQATVLLLIKKENAYWTEEHLDIILTFLYAIDGKDKVEAPVGIVINLPDNQKTSVSTKPINGEDHVPSGVSQKREPAGNRRTDPGYSKDSGPDNACLDSLAFHHRQLLNIYREISHNPVIDKSKKKQLRKQFEYHNAKFHALQDSCNLQQSIYNDGYDRVENELHKHLGYSSKDDISLSRNKNPENEEGQASQDASNTINRSKILNYVLLAIFLLVVSYYIFSKIKKKKK